MKTILALLSAIGLFGGPAFAAGKPSVLFIAIDDQNDWLSSSLLPNTP